MKQYSCLVVEDSPMMRQLVVFALGRLRHLVVTEADDGVDGLRKLAAGSFDIILTDINMPIMDGLTCSREIRQLQKDGKIIRHVNIIATTANVRAEQIQRALASGVVSFLSFAFTLYSCFTTCLGMNDTDYYRIP